MRKPTFVVLLSCLALTSAGCTWVKLEPQARGIRVVPMEADMSACERRGEVAVAVKDGVGPVGRNELKVRDELETLARNEAAGLAADTVQAKAAPSRGQQRFLAFRCGSAVPTTAAPRRAESLDDRRVESDREDVEVFRIE